MTLEFAEPGYLYLLVLLPIWWLSIWRRPSRGIRFARGLWFGRSTLRSKLISSVLLGIPILFRSGVIASLVVALAHPQQVRIDHHAEIRGRGMALAVDVSTSMLAADMGDEQSRLMTARAAAARFVEGRSLDQVSLIAFAGQAVTRVPPTRDPHLVIAGMESLNVQLVLDGTNISQALLTSVAQLRESESEERVIVLLTDGAHNGMGVSPLTAARAASAFGVRVHSIALVGRPAIQDRSLAESGAGTPPRRSRAESEMETVLTAVSRITGGQYFSASNGPELESIFRAIDDMEGPVRSVIERKERVSRRAWPLLIGLLLLGLDVALLGSRWSVVP